MLYKFNPSCPQDIKLNINKLEQEIGKIQLQQVFSGTWRQRTDCPLYPRKVYREFYQNIQIWYIQKFSSYQYPWKQCSAIIKEISHINFEHIKQLILNDLILDNIQFLSIMILPNVQFIMVQDNFIVSFKTLGKNGLRNLSRLRISQRSSICQINSKDSSSYHRIKNEQQISNSFDLSFQQIFGNWEKQMWFSFYEELYWRVKAMGSGYMHQYNLLKSLKNK